MNKKLLDLVKKNSELWWWVAEDAKVNLSEESVVEAVLNYGDEKVVKTLLDILGTDRVAKIFFIQSNKPRSNYFPLIKHFFTLYFHRHASKDTYQ